MTTDLARLDALLKERFGPDAVAKETQVTTPDTPLDLDAIRRRLMNATDGPWAIWPDLKPDGLITIGDATGVIPEGEMWTDGPSNTVAHVYTEEDAEFILHAPQDVAALLSALAAVTAEAETYRYEVGHADAEREEAVRELAAAREQAKQAQADRDAAIEEQQIATSVLEQQRMLHGPRVERRDARIAELERQRDEILPVLRTVVLAEHHRLCGESAQWDIRRCEDADCNERAHLLERHGLLPEEWGAYLSPSGPKPTVCPAEYTRPGGRQRGDRIVRCHLPYGHGGEHEEAETECTWLDAEPVPAGGEDGSGTADGALPDELCSDKNGFHDGHDWTPDPCEPYRWCPGYPVPRSPIRTCGFGGASEVTA